MKKLIVATAVALSIASPAWAQDTNDAPQESVFTGPSIAGFVGIDVLTIQENNAADAARGLLFGGSVGYDHQVGSVILGVQAEISDSAASYDVQDLIVPGDEFSARAGRDIYVGARLGFPASRNAMVYVGGGYVNSRITSVYEDNAGTVSQEETKEGFRVTAGGELVSGKFFGRLEMRYQDVGDFTVFGVPTGFARTNTQIVAGLGFRL